MHDTVWNNKHSLRKNIYSSLHPLYNYYYYYKLRENFKHFMMKILDCLDAQAMCELMEPYKKNSFSYDVVHSLFKLKAYLARIVTIK